MSSALAISPKAPPAQVYPALIAAALVNNAADPAVNPVVGTTFSDTEITDAAGEKHTLSVAATGQEAVYGLQAVLSKLLEEHGSALKGAKGSGKLVRSPKLSTGISAILIYPSLLTTATHRRKNG